MRHIRRIALTLALGASLAVTGCSSATPTPEKTTSNGDVSAVPVGPGTNPTGSAGSGTDAPDTSGTTEPTETTVDPVIQSAAEGFIAARENQTAHYHQTVTGWLEEARPFLTVESHAALLAQAEEALASGGNPGFEWDTSHAEGFAVQTLVEPCQPVEDAENHATTANVSCPLTDIVIGVDGEPVETHRIPNLWFTVGPQPDVLLTLTLTPEGWRVASDNTFASTETD